MHFQRERTLENNFILFTFYQKSRTLLVDYFFRELDFAAVPQNHTFQLLQNFSSGKKIIITTGWYFSPQNWIPAKNRQKIDKVNRFFLIFSLILTSRFLYIYNSKDLESPTKNLHITHFLVYLFIMCCERCILGFCFCFLKIW